MKSCNYLLTINNPTVTLHELSEYCKSKGVSTFVAQLERGEAGTAHFQVFIQFTSKRHFTAVKKLFPTAHVETAKNALKSYNYCKKDDTRVEGPIEWGPIPKPKKSIAGDTAEFNRICIEQGPETLVAEGRLHIRDYARIK